MFATQKPTPFPFERWGFDNGAYKAWQDAGFPIGLTLDDWCILFPVEEFERRLKEAESVDSDPWVAVTPDIPGSAESLAYSIEWRKDLVNGWPWFLAVQDGMQVEAVENALHMFAGIFLGGSDDLARSKKFSTPSAFRPIPLIPIFRFGQSKERGNCAPRGMGSDCSRL